MHQHTYIFEKQETLEQQEQWLANAKRIMEAYEIGCVKISPSITSEGKPAYALLFEDVLQYLLYNQHVFGDKPTECKHRHVFDEPAFRDVFKQSAAMHLNTLGIAYTCEEVGNNQLLFTFNHIAHRQFFNTMIPAMETSARAFAEVTAWQKELNPHISIGQEGNIITVELPDSLKDSASVEVKRPDEGLELPSKL